MKSTVLVTGASAGIGATYAERFAKRGHDLILVARDEKRLRALAHRLSETFGVAVDVLPADLTDPKSLAQVERRLRDDGRIDVLVNNAGASSKGGFAADDHEPLFKLVDLNVVALTRLASAAVLGFKQHGTKGAIINVGSVVGFAPEWMPGVYGATKAYVLTLSRSMQTELRDAGLYVQAVLPAATRTEIWQKAGKNVDDIPGMMDVEELVDAALVGFDRREEVTIPPLPDVGQWTNFEAARTAMLPNFANAHAAERYRAQ